MILQPPEQRFESAVLETAAALFTVVTGLLVIGDFVFEYINSAEASDQNDQLVIQTLEGLRLKEFERIESPPGGDPDYGPWPKGVEPEVFSRTATMIPAAAA